MRTPHTSFNQLPEQSKWKGEVSTSPRVSPSLTLSSVLSRRQGSRSRWALDHLPLLMAVQPAESLLSLASVSETKIAKRSAQAAGLRPADPDTGGTPPALGKGRDDCSCSVVHRGLCPFSLFHPIPSAQVCPCGSCPSLNHVPGDCWPCSRGISLSSELVPKY